ncbi:uncharacterized protein LOC132048983 [Lycium ferocissimum]|uniref:uncharacterized protein LOC132048983 n=1 Tax=Lycium ferocissimum TaxID=112874 RepID=UPI0028166CFE|nr:uncharacterized protein LOC132048983 [Lycium ferocissimum]
MTCIKTVSYSILINSNPTPPFDAKRGVRQGEALSPFLFVLAMEYLSRILKNLKNSLDFNFHPRCEKLNLVQLGFADDLLLFCRGDLGSATMLYDAFQLFSSSSSLIANQGKSCIYFGGVTPEDQQEITQALGFTTGTLPFRYLGVPLSSKRLSIGQCQPLLDKMVGKITIWTTKFLSYAGRLQLIKSVLLAIQNFWSQIFILPQKIIQQIETICRKFLWTGSVEPLKSALIAWILYVCPR